VHTCLSAGLWPNLNFPKGLQVVEHKYALALKYIINLG
jgi:hypothetical protein